MFTKLPSVVCYFSRMEESDHKNPNASSAQPDSGSTMGRALLSAAVFGSIGAFLGRWLGKRGNADGSNMAQPIMQWGMGGFWALLAAYSALKKNDPVVRDDKPLKRPPEVKSPIRDYSTAGELIEAQASTLPAAQVQQATAQAQGVVQDLTSQLAAQK